jgi:hypothetical protein
MAITPLALSALLQATALQPFRGVAARPVDLLLQQTLGTQVSLSSFGRLQSVVGGVADAAAGLRSGTGERDGVALRGTVARFVAVVNTAGRVTENELFARLVGGAGLLTDDAGGLQAVSELLRGVDDPARNGGVELGPLGIFRQPDGQLRFDAAVFTEARAADPEGVAAALDRLGETVLGVATQELSAGGRLNAATATFDFLMASLQAQQVTFGAGGATSAFTADSSLLLLNNPFLFQGADAFRLISSL